MVSSVEDRAATLGFLGTFGVQTSYPQPFHSSAILETALNLEGIPEEMVELPEAEAKWGEVTAESLLRLSWSCCSITILPRRESMLIISITPLCL